MQWSRAPWRSERPVDTGIALVVLVFLLQPVYDSAQCGCDPFPWWGYLLIGLEVLPLVWRRRWPFVMPLLSGVCTFLYGISSLHDAAVSYAGLVGLYTVAAYASRRLALTAGAIAVLGIGASMVIDARADLQDAVTNYLLFAMAWLLGDSTRGRRERARVLEARAEQLERTRAAESQRAVVEERNRIARELHDVVTHSVSLMVVQAEAGPVVVESDPERAVAVFDSISATGKEALTEMRRLLGVLRAGDGDDERLVPQPGLDRLTELVAGARTAGLDVELDVHGPVRSLGAALELSAYRVVQEALTNAVRHSSGSRATVRVSYREEALEVVVDDDGAGRGPARLPHGGNGLLAMRERVALIDGRLEAGPVDGGGWRVAVELPVQQGRRPS